MFRQPIHVAGKLVPFALDEVKKIEDLVRFHFGIFPMREVSQGTLNRAIYDYITQLTSLIIKIDEDGRVQFPIPEAINVFHDMACVYASTLPDQRIANVSSMRLMTGYGVCIRTCYLLAKKLHHEKGAIESVPEVGTPDPPVWPKQPAKVDGKVARADAIVDQC